MAANFKDDITNTERIQNFNRDTFQTICSTCLERGRFLVDDSCAQVGAVEGIRSCQTFQ